MMVDVPLVPWSEADHWAPDHLVIARRRLVHATRLRGANDSSGDLITAEPLGRASETYPAWARGPFARISPEAELVDGPAVYALFSDGRVRYVGGAENLARTFGTRGLGEISRRDCQRTEREEMCWLNRNITAEMLAGRVVDLYYESLPRRESPLEAAQELRTFSHGDWNLPE